MARTKSTASKAGAKPKAKPLPIAKPKRTKKRVRWNNDFYRARGLYTEQHSNRLERLAVHDLLRRGGALDRLSLKSRRVRPPAAPPGDGGEGAGRIRAGGRAVQGEAARATNPNTPLM